MFWIELAGVIVEIDNQYEEIERLCREYKIEETSAQVSVRVTTQELYQEKEGQLDCYGEIYRDSYLETICAYRQIAVKLLPLGVLLLHASVLELEGKGYAFLGPSGIGKSTQTRLWKQYFGEKIRVINGDKPLLRFEQQEGKTKIFACGTPWCGKEGYGCRGEVPLYTFFFLKQSEKPAVRSLGQAEVFERLLHQMMIPKEQTSLDKHLQLVEKLLEQGAFYELACDQTLQSVEMALRVIDRGNS